MLKNSYIVWEGASLIDGSPIALILTGFVSPFAAKQGSDEGICGSCNLKLSKTGSCYINLAPINSMYRKYVAGTYLQLSKNEIELLKYYRYPIRIFNRRNEVTCSLNRL